MHVHLPHPSVANPLEKRGKWKKTLDIVPNVPLAFDIVPNIPLAFDIVPKDTPTT